MGQMVNKEKSLQEELLEAKTEIIELRASSKTTLTGAQFLAILLVGPLFLSFCALGVLIVWKTVSKPAEVAAANYYSLKNPNFFFSL